MLVTGAPQFPAQDDSGHGDGIDPIVQWQMVPASPPDAEASFTEVELDPAVDNILTRLRYIFHQQQRTRLSTNELHDLTCFVVHKLLLLPPFLPAHGQRSNVSECLRYALVLYMLAIHGTTYYHHEALKGGVVSRLQTHLAAAQSSNSHSSNSSSSTALGFWMLFVSAVAVPSCGLFRDLAAETAAKLGFRTWEDARAGLESVLWTGTGGEEAFRRVWDEINNGSSAPTAMK